MLETCSDKVQVLFSDVDMPGLDSQAGAGRLFCC
jgi:hypothetical protein